MISSGNVSRTTAGLTGIKGKVCLGLLLLGVLLKFWLIANTDISDAMDDPYEYVLQVLHPMDAGIADGPGTGLFGFFFYKLGIPFGLSSSSRSWELSSGCSAP